METKKNIILELTFQFALDIIEYCEGLGQKILINFYDFNCHIVKLLN